MTLAIAAVMFGVLVSCAPAFIVAWCYDRRDDA